MSATIIDGRTIAEEIRAGVEQDVRAFVENYDVRPTLVSVQVGNSAASRIYTRMQARSCEQTGIEYRLEQLHADASEGELLSTLAMINADPSASAVILQMPLPEGFDTRRLQMALSADKDVEGIHPVNLGKLFYGAEAVAPCTPMAVMDLLRRVCDDLRGREVVIVGHSEIVGKPIAMMLLQSFDSAPTVRICHAATRELERHVREAEVLIVAAGASRARWERYRSACKAGQNPSPPDLSPLIPASMLRPGAVVIDVAINRLPVGLDDSGEPLRDEEGRARMMTTGDVEYDAALEKVSAITPVPGGVGPVTVAMLLRNVVTCAKLSSTRRR